MTDSELISDYLAHAKTTTRDGTDAEHFDAHEQLDELVTDEPERAWPVICEIIRRISREDEDILAYVAAGPLEDLLARHPKRLSIASKSWRQTTPIFVEHSRVSGAGSGFLRISGRG